jgi:hypothetical protein
VTSKEHLWERLQTRAALGEPLSEEEERERARLAELDPIAGRELALIAELKRVVNAPDALEPSVLAILLERLGLKASPRLRLVQRDEALPRAETPVPRRSRGRAVAVALGAAAVAAGAGAWLVAGEPAPLTAPPNAVLTQATEPATARSEVMFASGDVKIGDAPVRIGSQTLREGERLSTGRGQVCFRIDPAIDVCLESSSAATLSSLRPHDVRVRVDDGTAVAALTTRAPGQAFSLLGVDVRAAARGTIFAVSLVRSERHGSATGARVLVLEGRVEVSRGASEPVLVGEHSSLALGSFHTPEPVHLARGEESRLLALIGRRQLWQTAELGVLSIDAGAPGTRALVGTLPAMSLPLTSFAPVGKHRVTLRDGSGADVTTEVEILPGQTQRVQAPTLAGPSRTKLEAPASQPVMRSAAQLLSEARRELSLGNSERALSLYLRLRDAHPQSPEASTVLVTIGKMELDRGAAARGLNAFETYLREGGPLAQEALAGKIRALRALGRSTEERAAIQRYLARHPNGFDAPALRKRLESP